MSTRGVIYLNAERAGQYLAQEKKPSRSEEKVLVEKAVEEARKLLRTVPDGNRILGGYCTDSALSKQISDIQDLAPRCREKLKIYQNKSNLHSALFWSFLGATAASGLGMAIGGFAAQDGQTRAGFVLGFGIPMLTFALTNAIGPFARISSAEKTVGERIDNYMWTLRRRISVEVCTAPNQATAAYRLAKIYRSLHSYCASNETDDGLYRMAEQ